MIKKSVIAVVAMVALLALVFAASGSLDNKDNKDNKSTTNSSSNQEKQQDSSTNNTTQQNTTEQQTKISSEQAQEIAQKFIEQPGATAGTPQLTEIDGKSIYVVPVMVDGKSVGEIEIDAQTGENLGGAGGVS